MNNQDLWVQLRNEAYEKNQLKDSDFDWKKLLQKMEKMEEEQEVNEVFSEIVPTHEQKNYVRSLIKMKIVKPNICFHSIEAFKEYEEKTSMTVYIYPVGHISFEAGSLTELLKQLHFMFIMQPEEMTAEQAGFYLYEKANEGTHSIILDGIESIEDWENFWRK